MIICQVTKKNMTKAVSSNPMATTTGGDRQQATTTARAEPAKVNDIVIIGAPSK